MGRTDIIEKMGSEIERKFRLNEVLTTIKNRINWEQNNKFAPLPFEEKMQSIGKIEAYTDVLRIIEKEMEMDIPYDELTFVEMEIKGSRDYFMDELIDMNQYRGTRDYDKMFVLKRKLASALENTIFNFFELGYKYGKGE